MYYKINFSGLEILLPGVANRLKKRLLSVSVKGFQSKHSMKNPEVGQILSIKIKINVENINENINYVIITHSSTFGITNK